MTPQLFPARHVHNQSASRSRPYGEAERRILSREAFDAARAEIASWPGYAPTPLIVLPGLAKALGIGRLHYKDEGKRFGLKSFKALGGAYGVRRIVRDYGRGVTVAAATDGNHGRSVAWGAQMFGARCIIYLHAHVSQEREDAIAAYGAEIRRVPGSYDDSVRACAVDAAREGWHLVADTNAGGGGDVIPRLVMQGYTVMVGEFLTQVGAATSHVFVQGGVGGLAAAVAGHLWEALGTRRPRVVVVEPERADCIFRSISAGAPTVVPGDTGTFMACLSAAEVSPLAWPILNYAADDVISLPDEAAMEAMRLLAAGTGGDPPIVAGESGCAATAGLAAVALDRELRTALDLTAASAVVVIGSEGATDPKTYERVVGKPADAVAA